jgi:hypothetical protein
MRQPLKLLEIPDDLRTLAWRGVVQVLQEDPALHKIVKTWLTRDGDPDGLQDPAADMTPMIALSPTPRPDSVLTNVSMNVNLGIAVGVWVPGSCVDDHMNLWGLVTKALRLEKPYRDGTVYKFLRCGIPGVSIPNLNVVDPAFIQYLPGDRDGDPSMQRGTGSIGLYFERPR